MWRETQTSPLRKPHHPSRDNCEKDSPFLVSAFRIMSPFTMVLRMLGRSERKSCDKAKVLILAGQKPWKVSAFSHHVFKRMSSPERPLMLMGSTRPKTMSRWLLIRKAKGMTRD
jgi:hypothetical protein